MTNGLMVLGAEPERLVVRLTTGADFRCDMVLRGVDYPDGATLTLDFGSTSWAATISGDTASFSEGAAVADAIANKTPVSLVYTETGSTQIWGIGEVIR